MNANDVILLMDIRSNKLIYKDFLSLSYVRVVSWGR
jgi:hypothetical protein